MVPDEMMGTNPGLREKGSIFPANSLLKTSKSPNQFPVVSGQNLNRKMIEFPRDLQGILNLLIIPFKQNQQSIVNTWIPVLGELEAKVQGFYYYELPTLAEFSAFSRMFINEGMRAGIQNEIAREKTITLYIDKQSFKTALNIPHEDDIHLFLVDGKGNIFWKTMGGYSPEKADTLKSFCRDLLAASI